MKKVISIWAAWISVSGTLLAQDPLVQYVSVASRENASIIASFVTGALTATELTAGSGITAATGGTWNWNGWDTESLSFVDAVAAGDFFTWGFTATAEVTPEELEIRLDRSGTGPDDFEIQMSLNGGAPISLLTHDYGDSAVGVDFTNIDLTSLGTLDNGDTVVFTLAAFNSETTGGSFDIENSGGVGINILGVSSVPTLTITTDQSSYGEADGTSAGEIIVSRTGDVSAPLTVSLSVDAANVGDVSIPATITIAADDFEGFASFGPEDDSEAEPTESILLTAMAPGFVDAITSFDILDNDTPSTLLINEVLSDPPADVDVNGDGVADTGDDEFLEFVNVSGALLDLSGWTVADGITLRHTFPNGSLLEDGCAIVVTGAGGVSLPAFVGTTVIQAASSGGLSLNNAGDTITVTDSSGQTVQILAYGADGVPVGVDGSINLNPDLADGSSYTLHNEVVNAVGDFSFGTAVDGSDPCATEFLAVTLNVSSVSETGAAGTVIGTVTRTGGDNVAALVVSLLSNDLSELIVPVQVTIPAGVASMDFDITIVDDSQVDGDRVVEISAGAFGVASGSFAITVVDAGDVFVEPELLVINEVWTDDNVDEVDYIELFGTPGASLSGLSLVAVSGAAGFEGTLNYSFEFTDETIPADGFFLIASGLDATADVIESDVFLPNFTQTYAIVRTADLYVEGGILTASSLAATAIDAVALLSAGDPTVYYGATEISPNAGGFPQSLAFRLVDGVGTTSADWGFQDNFLLAFGSAEDLLSTPGVGNVRTASPYSVSIADSFYSVGTFSIIFDAGAALSDIYVSTNLVDFDLAMNGASVPSGTYVDSNPPAVDGRAFYLIQEAGTEAP